MSSTAFLVNPGNANFLAGRTRTLSRPFSWVLVFFLVPFVAIGIFILVMAAKQLTPAILLNLQGRQTDGVILGTRLDDSGDSTSYYASFRYDVGSRSYTVEESIDHELYRRLRQEQSIRVTYIPSNPATASLDIRRNLTQSFIFLGFALAWNGVVGAFFYHVITTILKHQRLEQAGSLIPGMIVTCSGDTDSDNDYMFSVTAQFLSPQSSTWVTSKQTLKREDLRGTALPPSGTSVQVLYLDDTTHVIL